MDNVDTKETPTPQDGGIRPLYRGAWIDVLKDGDRIPLGGSIFSDEPTTFVIVDFDWIEKEAGGVTNESLKEAYEKNRENFEKFINERKIKLDPEFFHAFFQIQKKADSMLKVDNSSSISEARRNIYANNPNPKLSDFIGISACGERAIVGKILFDKIGIKSSYMGGVHVDSREDEPSDHSFLILDDPQGEGSLIFDITRPKASIPGFPRILRTDQKITYETFKGKRNLVIPVIDIYDERKLYYGVGNPYLVQDVNFSD